MSIKKFNYICRCGCGRLFDEHHTIVRNQSREDDFLGTISEHETWRIQENTELFPTNAFGTLDFQGADIHTTKAEVKFYYLSVKTQAKISDLLCQSKFYPMIDQISILKKMYFLYFG